VDVPADVCAQDCYNDANCNYYGTSVGPVVCQLFGIPLLPNILDDPGSPYHFYDRSCVVPNSPAEQSSSVIEPPAEATSSTLPEADATSSAFTSETPAPPTPPDGRR